MNQPQFFVILFSIVVPLTLVLFISLVIYSRRRNMSSIKPKTPNIEEQPQSSPVSALPVSAPNPNRGRVSQTPNIEEQQQSSPVSALPVSIIGGEQQQSSSVSSSVSSPVSSSVSASSVSSPVSSSVLSPQLPSSNTVKGSGSFGTVTSTHTKGKVKKVMTQPYPHQKQYAQKQLLLNSIDTSRQVFGGKIDPPLSLHSDKELNQFQMKDEGTSLDQWMDTHPHEDDRYKLLTSFLSLLKGFEKLNTKGYVHGDVKSSNIVVNDDNQTLKMIDYDNMNTKPFVFHENILSNRRIGYYFVWPPEIILTNPIVSNSYQQKEWGWDGFCQRNSYLSSLLRTYQRLDGYKESYKKWYKKTKIYGHIIMDDTSRQFRVFDVYALGIVALSLFFPLFQKYPLLPPIIDRMICPDASTRLTIEEAKYEWYHFLHSLTPVVVVPSSPQWNPSWGWYLCFDLDKEPSPNDWCFVYDHEEDLWHLSRIKESISTSGSSSKWKCQTYNGDVDVDRHHCLLVLPSSTSSTTSTSSSKIVKNTLLTFSKQIFLPSSINLDVNVDSLDCSFSTDPLPFKIPFFLGTVLAISYLTYVRNDDVVFLKRSDDSYTYGQVIDMNSMDIQVGNDSTKNYGSLYYSNGIRNNEINIFSLIPLSIFRQKNRMCWSLPSFF